MQSASGGGSEKMSKHMFHLYCSKGAFTLPPNNNMKTNGIHRWKSRVTYQLFSYNNGNPLSMTLITPMCQHTSLTSLSFSPTQAYFIRVLILLVSTPYLCIFCFLHTWKMISVLDIISCAEKLRTIEK